MADIGIALITGSTAHTQFDALLKEVFGLMDTDNNGTFTEAEGVKLLMKMEPDEFKDEVQAR